MGPGRQNSTVTSFEDLEVWKRAARLSAEIYRELQNLKDRGRIPSGGATMFGSFLAGKPRREGGVLQFGFRNQITRSGLSIPSNIAEGFERKSHKEFAVFLNYARGSCGELRTQVHIGREIGYISAAAGRAWVAESKEISAMITALIKTTRGYIKEPSKP
jgi:four helix bundle protein